MAGALVGPTELLVHNAGSLGPVPLRPLSDTDDAGFEEALATNLLAPFRLVGLDVRHGLLLATAVAAVLLWRLAPPPVGGVTTVPLAKPFASTAMPPATSAKMITMRAVPRFTRPILP